MTSARTAGNFPDDEAVNRYSSLAGRSERGEFASILLRHKTVATFSVFW